MSALLCLTRRSGARRSSRNSVVTVKAGIQRGGDDSSSLESSLLHPHPSRERGQSITFRICQLEPEQTLEVSPEDHLLLVIAKALKAHDP